MSKYNHELLQPCKNNWQSVLAQAVREPQELLQLLKLTEHPLAQQVCIDKQFPLLVPRTFVQRMRSGNADDPLLRQVLSVADEQLSVQGYTQDPLDEQASNVSPGLIHKYHGRVLLIAASGCAVNCRYCFRRHFPYADNRVGRQQWHSALNYVAQDSSISEVILSGGDPLLLGDEQLSELLEQIAAIAHVKRLRIHSRLPVVIPQRLTAELMQLLSQSRLRTSLVLHINHAQELAPEHLGLLAQYRAAGITLLNQTVLLKGVNDDEQTLCQLSETLFDYGVLPYYLHQLDRVQGAQHFALSAERTQELYRHMQQYLPGYLVPKLVCEQAGQPHKTLIPIGII
ncbi:EF-P beta-lysylation protein EpmB [Thiopseudomonas acetoxidans]|uniref:L-lysine 2,3-aminomutase n=1 Tax=Thiopseudomonas acetoxidans TaxID=3041622 RepID=A0ABT7SQC9_9GAMM|nr:EF-P beta-lysylation protein EpmB [Thiopseudomonas sp. CY1220]MDM7858381.1 EF-P beta-lysylation protein EpmB [Thiopseudomonas sp. CY1220]